MELNPINPNLPGVGELYDRFFLNGPVTYLLFEMPES